MTYTLFFAIISLGAWIISHNLNVLKKLTGFMFATSLIILVVTDIISSFNLTFGLFILAKNLLILGAVSMVLNLCKQNLFAQIGIYVCMSLFLFNRLPHHNDLQAFNVDREWELIINVEGEAIPPRLKDIVDHYQLVLDKFDPEDEDQTDLDNFYAVGIPQKHEGKARRIFSLIDNTEGVGWIEYNEKVYRILPEPGTVINAKKLRFADDPLTNKQWSLQALNMDEYYQYITDNKISPINKANLFILDTGVDINHEDLDSDRSKSSKDYTDTKGHGTHCAGIAAAISNNGKGIASMVPDKNWVNVNSVKVFTDFGITTQKRIIDGIIKAVDEGADVINMSLGARAYQKKEKAYAEAINYAVDHGTILIAAAGNSSDDAKNYVPANLNEVITVTSIDNTQSLSSFSNYITNVSYGIAAPGQDILSTYNNGKYEVKSGTSMAAPHVAGLAAVFKALKPELTHQEFHWILHAAGNDSNNTLKSGKIINPLESLKLLVERNKLN